MAKDSFPSSTLFHYPILKLLADGSVHSRTETQAVSIKELSISESDKSATTPKGRNKVATWNDYALKDLKSANFIKHFENGYVITDAGMSFLQSHTKGFVANDLKESEGYRRYKKTGEFKKEKKDKSTNKSEVSMPEPELDAAVSIEHLTKEEPIEVLEKLSAHINDTLEDTLLKALKKMPPEAFETLIKELIIKMDICQSVEQTQYVKDDGVDLYVYDNILKMNVVCCIQVKRYSDKAVGLSTVKELVGTLVDKNCRSGMVFTTSTFSKGALDYNPSGYNIQKIDGKKLTKLLVTYGLGIKTKTIEVNTVDIDYLNNLEYKGYGK